MAYFAIESFSSYHLCDKRFGYLPSEVAHYFDKLTGQEIAVKTSTGYQSPVIFGFRLVYSSKLYQIITTDNVPNKLIIIITPHIE